VLAMAVVPAFLIKAGFRQVENPSTIPRQARDYMVKGPSALGLRYLPFIGRFRSRILTSLALAPTNPGRL
jgi:hypothetical protein